MQPMVLINTVVEVIVLILGGNFKKCILGVVFLAMKKQCQAL